MQNGKGLEIGNRLRSLYGEKLAKYRDGLKNITI
jgi:hypothetical protein